MLEKLYENIDSKVLTAEVRESLESEFAAAVESRAQSVAESIVSDLESEYLYEKEQYIQRIDESMDEYQGQLEGEYQEKAKELEEFKEKYKLEINEQAQRYIDERMAEINNQIDLYAQRVADLIVKESKESLEQSNKDLTARSMYEALCKFASMAGYNLGKELDESTKQQERNFNKKINNLIKENKQLKRSLRSAKNKLVFEEMTRDMSLYERERARRGLGSTVETMNESDLKSNLTVLKESRGKGRERLSFKSKATPNINSLLFKKI